MEEFTQGTIIECIRSEKYKGIRCSGVVISARCDIAQNKIPFFHCLTALQLDDWIYEVLFYVILEEKIKQVRNGIESFCQNNQLDAETLLDMNDKEKDIVLTANIKKKKEREKIKSLIEKLSNLNTLHSKGTERIKKKNFMIEEKKAFEKQIIYLYNSNFPKYVFVPQKAYSVSESSVLGIVVDLQDIHQFNMNFVDALQSYKYDYQTLEDENERKNLNEIFFFEKEDDFVLASDNIKSPWIEYLLQSFSFSFIRIGLDNASEQETKKFCEEWLEGK